MSSLSSLVCPENFVSLKMEPFCLLAFFPFQRQSILSSNVSERAEVPVETEFGVSDSSISVIPLRTCLFYCYFHLLVIIFGTLFNMLKR